MLSNSKKKDLIKLINLAVIPSRGANKIIRSFVYIALRNKDRKDDLDIIVREVVKKIKKSSFLERAIVPYLKKFTHDEIKEIINFFESKVGKNFFGPKSEDILYFVYVELTNLAKDLLENPSKYAK
jgi:hypothetical protein